MDNQLHYFSSIPHLVGAVVALPIVLYLASAFHSLFLHPLRHVPGPKLNAISRLPYVRHHYNGTIAQYFKQLHDQYGAAVRYSPNEVSFISSETAWTEIYGFRTGRMKGHASTSKDPVWFAPPVNGVPALTLANDADHTRGRRIIAHAFSEKALAAQEKLLHGYADLLIDGLRDAATTGTAPINVVRWYNWTTFDIISDLTFGEPFGCLRMRATHKFVDLMLSSIQSQRLFYIMKHYPWTTPLFSFLLNRDVIESRRNFAKWTAEKTQERMARETERADFMTYILQHNGSAEKGLSDKEIKSNAILFLGAGTETTATLLSGATFLLCRNPAVYAKLKAEVRARWASYGDITLESAQRLPYLDAVLHESLRYFPPVPTGFNRIIPAGGEVVSGHFIPEGTSVCVSSHAAHHSERNFTDPEAFVPERWMGDEKYATDKREWVQPFSYGPRNCLGKNLAWAELRIIMAKLVWSFDFELPESSLGWMEKNRVMLVWLKPELLVNVTPVQRG